MVPVIVTESVGRREEAALHLGILIKEKTAMSKSRSVSRSSRTGRFVSKATAARSPRKTTTERVGAGTSNSRPVNRSATTGRFVTAATAKRNPSGTIRQMV